MAAPPRTATTTRRSHRAPTTATPPRLYIQKLRGKRPLLTYGISSGALRAAMFAERHPDMVARLALDAMVWTGEGSPTLAERRKKLPEFSKINRRPMSKAFIHSVFDRDHPGTAERRVIEAFADAVVALDDSVPTGTYVDMCSRLPVVDPEKITVPTLIMRGQHDGIASLDDLLKFFAKLGNPDKQFSVMAGISHASFQQKNYMMVYHILAEFFAYAGAGVSGIKYCRSGRAKREPGSTLRSPSMVHSVWVPAFAGTTAISSRADPPNPPNFSAA